MQRLCSNRARATLPCLPPRYPRGVRRRRGEGVAGGMCPAVPAAVLRPTLTSSGKPWEAAPGPRRGRRDTERGSACTGSVPAAGVRPVVAAWGRAGHRRGLGYGQDENENGVRLIIKHRRLDVTSRLGNP